MERTLKRWIVGSVGVGVAMLASTSLDEMWDFHPLLLGLISGALWLVAVLMAVVSVVALRRNQSLNGKQVALPALICLAVVVAKLLLPWEQLADHLSWPLREPVFEALTADFAELPDLRLFCFWDSGHYRINDVFYDGPQDGYWTNGSRGNKVSLEKESVFARAGLTDAGVRGLAKRMGALGVSCVEKFQDGDVHFTTWGMLDNECGYMRLARGASDAKSSLGQFRYIRGKWLAYCY